MPGERRVERRENTNNAEEAANFASCLPQKRMGRQGAASIQRVTVPFSLRDFLQLPVTIDNDKWTDGRTRTRGHRRKGQGGRRQSERGGREAEAEEERESNR